MAILTRSGTELEDLVGARVQSVEEIDLLTGKAIPVLGKPLSSIGRLDTVHVYLGERMQVAGFIPVEHSPNDIRAISEGLSLLYQRNWTELLLSSSLRPLEPEAPTDLFYEDIADRLMNAMMARYVIIRRIVNEEGSRHLRCEALKDRSGRMNTDLRYYDIPSTSPSSLIYEQVEEAFIESQWYLRFLYKAENPDTFAVWSHMPGTEKIQTILISAMTLGNSVRGFINVGYDFRFELNDYLRDTFATTFNHVCAAIENHHTMTQVEGLRRAELGEFLTRSNLEFIQGFRHMAQNALFEADIASRKMMAFYNFKGDKKNDPAVDLKSASAEIQSAFNRMAAMKNLAEGKEIADLINVFEDAIGLLKHQVEATGADVRIQRLSSGSMEALVNVTAMHHAFGNLILNCLDVFNEVNLRKSDRKVTVQFRDNKDSILIDVIDEGPGIRILGNIRQVGDIWLPGKTTKKKGTGYGLPFVRKIIQEVHSGSINLRPSSRGAIFGIVLKKNQGESDR